MKIACGFAAGMSRLGETCGAVTGAYLVISLMHGRYLVDDLESKENTFQLIQEFEKRFNERNESTNCKKLLGFDLRDCDKEKAIIKVREVCPKAVKDAAEILEALLFQSI